MDSKAVGDQFVPQRYYRCENCLLCDAVPKRLVLCFGLQEAKKERIELGRPTFVLPLHEVTIL